MPSHQDKTVLITGSGGFIGPFIVDMFLKYGVKVRTLTGAPNHCVKEPPSEVQSFRADISDIGALDELVRDIQVVVHAAGPASVAASFKEAPSFARDHVVGTTNLLDACSRTGVRRLVYLSSAEVYGQPRTNPVSESHPVSARSPYAAAKIGAEQFVLSFAYAFGLEAVILRPFSIYGPGQPETSVIGSILSQALRKVPVLLNDLKPIRDYCFADDLADAVFKACTVKISEPTLLNIGTGQGTSVGDLAHLVLQAQNLDLPVSEKEGAERPGKSEINKLIADATQAEKILSWIPKTDLLAGLKKTIHSQFQPLKRKSIQQDNPKN